MTKLVIKNPEDRRVMVSILADNGYNVKIDREKVGKVMKSVVIAWTDEETKDE